MEVQLSLSHLGYLPGSPKTLTLVTDRPNELPDRIPFYLRQNCFRMRRERHLVEGFSERFPAPYDLLQGKLRPELSPTPYFQGELERKSTRWGTLWQADFSAFTTPGSYQIEIDWQVSVPFAIRENLYDRIISGYLTFLRAQRCGSAIFGIHPACHLDDGVLDSNGTPWPATGGWHDAGDFRKWLAFTLNHVDALATVHERAGGRMTAGAIAPQTIVEEIRWGNRLFHCMMDAAGQLYEDVAGGSAPSGTATNYEQHWWFENHPGCYGDASDNRWTDNLTSSGDERKVRTSYNPLVQWRFVAVQARAARLLPEQEAHTCLILARRAAAYGGERGDDRRTLFVTAELGAALEMAAAGEELWSLNRIAALAETLLSRQETGAGKLSGYFLEADGADGYRSIAFAADPPLALLRLWELAQTKLSLPEPLARRALNAVAQYIDRYLLEDTASNPFGLTPYGIYRNRPHAGQQLFRDAGNGFGVRTFMHPFNTQGIAHGTSSVLMSHAHLLARAGHGCEQRRWSQAAERLLQWTLGHNTVNRSLYSGIGYRQPVGYSFRIPQLPEAMVTGFIGKPDDSPYLEETTAIEWNTLEYWSMPFVHAAQAACWL